MRIRYIHFVDADDDDAFPCSFHILIRSQVVLSCYGISESSRLTHALEHVLLVFIQYLPSKMFNRHTHTHTDRQNRCTKKPSSHAFTSCIKSVFFRHFFIHFPHFIASAARLFTFVWPSASYNIHI